MRRRYVANMATKRTPKTQKKPPKKLHTVAVRIDDDMREKLEAIAEDQARPVSNLIDFAVKEWLAGRGHRP